MKYFALLAIVLAATGVIFLLWRHSVSKKVVVGGLYASKQKGGTFLISKVLAVDARAIHVRIYANKFQTLPRDLDSSVLSLGGLGDARGFGLGHAPMAKDGWIDSHIFVKSETVRDDELDGYKYYLGALPKS